VINHVLKAQDGSGGVIALDKDGSVSMQFNTTGMFRATVKSGGNADVYIFKDR
jgi:beta-aspartyl-peptidase (threonine type)